MTDGTRTRDLPDHNRAFHRLNYSHHHASSHGQPRKADQLRPQNPIYHNHRPRVNTTRKHSSHATAKTERERRHSRYPNSERTRSIIGTVKPASSLVPTVTIPSCSTKPGTCRSSAHTTTRRNTQTPPPDALYGPQTAKLALNAYWEGWARESPSKAHTVKRLAPTATKQSGRAAKTLSTTGTSTTPRRQPGHYTHAHNGQGAQRQPPTGQRHHQADATCPDYAPGRSASLYAQRDSPAHA